MSLRWADYRPPAGSRAPSGRTPPGTVVYAIGDIHGRCDLLEAIQRGIAVDAKLRPARRRVIVYLGDYISRGGDSRGVVEMVRGHQLDGSEVVTLKGNHEDLLLRYLGGDFVAAKHWFDYDGLDALSDFGVETVDRQARDDATVELLRRRFAAALTPRELEFFRGLRVSHREGSYHFVHAGVRPGVALDSQTDHDQMWIRERFLNSGDDHGATVIHGHCIAAEPEIRANRIGIDTGAYRSGVLTCLVLDGTERAFLQT